MTAAPRALPGSPGFRRQSRGVILGLALLGLGACHRPVAPPHVIPPGLISTDFKQELAP